MHYKTLRNEDFFLKSIKNVGKHPSGILISSGSSWIIKPFLMFGLATLFFIVIFEAFIPADLAQDLVTGAVLLGVAPCTAMVFVWSLLTKGDPAHTLVQVSVYSDSRTVRSAGAVPAWSKQCSNTLGHTRVFGCPVCGSSAGRRGTYVISVDKEKRLGVFQRSIRTKV
jgi:hypothetical protein